MAFIFNEVACLGIYFIEYRTIVRNKPKIYILWSIFIITTIPDYFAVNFNKGWFSLLR